MSREPRATSRSRIENQRLVQTPGSSDGRAAVPLPRPDRSATNCMYFQVGTLRFGRLTMTNADSELIDDDPCDPFDLSRGGHVVQKCPSIPTWFQRGEELQLAGIKGFD